MDGRKYVVVTVLAWLVVILFSAYFSLDGLRMGLAEKHHTEQLIERGMEIYANNCAVCHGPLGEGVVGPALNRKELRGNARENKDIYDMIYRAVELGRPGTTTPHWERLPDGRWASFTAMPTWGSEQGGPLNRQQLMAVVTFIMEGDWSKVGAHIPPPRLPAPDMPEAEWMQGMPNAVGLTAAENARGKRLFKDKGCMSCHTLGSWGGRVGPDLTKVGSWSEDPGWAAFLKAWIDNPAAIPVDKRAPIYFSNYQGSLWTPPRGSVGAQRQASGRTTATGAKPSGEGGRDETIGGSAGPEIPLSTPIVGGHTVMPDMGLTNEELDALVKYLVNLK